MPTIDQHEGLDFRHPRGGQALYLHAPLFENYAGYLQQVASTVLTDGGEAGMITSVEDLAESGGVATRAPVLYDNLRRSGHPTVTSDGALVYDRPPHQHRLSEAELDALYRAHHPNVSKFSLRELRFLWATGFH